MDGLHTTEAALRVREYVDERVDDRTGEGAGGQSVFVRLLAPVCHVALSASLVGTRASHAPSLVATMEHILTRKGSCGQTMDGRMDGRPSGRTNGPGWAASSQGKKPDTRTRGRTAGRPVLGLYRAQTNTTHGRPENRRAGRTEDTTYGERAQPEGRTEGGRPANFRTQPGRRAGGRTYGERTDGHTGDRRTTGWADGRTDRALCAGWMIIDLTALSCGVDGEAAPFPPTLPQLFVSVNGYYIRVSLSSIWGYHWVL